MNKLKLLLLVLVTFLLGAVVGQIVFPRWENQRWLSIFKTGSTNKSASRDSSAPKQLWTCGMHPQVIQDHPGNCPICGMKLVPLRQPSTSTAGHAEHEGHAAAEAETGVRVSPQFLQNFAIKTEPVKRMDLSIQIRTVGILDYDERTIASVNTKFAGWIERPRVNYIGQPVKKGQVLFEIYSPELVTTQQEFLSALDYVSQLEERGHPEAIRRARALLEAARERLRYWDITDEQIEQLAQTRQLTRTLKVVSPVSGVVTWKASESLEGLRVSPGMNIYKIADLSTVWVSSELYEHQVQHVYLGQPVRITVDAFPGQHWMGKIVYLDPTINEKTRTLRAYVEIPNPNWRLRPGMYANVEVLLQARRNVLVVPEEAILYTGKRAVVIVEKQRGLFEPREIHPGITSNGYTEVRHGLHEGEVVVVSSQFLIDSESRLKEALRKMTGGEGEAPAAMPGHVH